MTIALDHILIPSRDRNAAAERLASLLGVPWAPAQIGPFTAVYVNDGLTLDFDEWQEDFPKGHYCFRVTETEFDAILQRIKDAGIPFRGGPHGPNDNTVNERMGGRIVYWNEPDDLDAELRARRAERALLNLFADEHEEIHVVTELPLRGGCLCGAVSFEASPAVRQNAALSLQPRISIGDRKRRGAATAAVCRRSKSIQRRDATVARSNRQCRHRYPRGS